MMGGFGRAALAGVALAFLVLLLGAVLVGLNVIELPDREATVTRILIIATAPDERGGEVAVLALVRDSAVKQTALLDTDIETSVPGTSARTARDAYPFGGGAVVARALAPQTGGTPLHWVVLPASTWERLIDAAGGVRTTIDRGISAYVDGSLTVVAPGERVLTGREAVALSIAAGYLEPQERDRLKRTLGTALGEAVVASDRKLGDLLASGEAQSDLEAERIAQDF